MRFLVLWFPDWPVQALPDRAEYMAVARAGEVWVCSHGARQAGVRRGMRVRHAQALCPRLEVVAEDQHRDAEAFEQVVASLDDFAAGVEVLRPGLNGRIRILFLFCTSLHFCLSHRRQDE